MASHQYPVIVALTNVTGFAKRDLICTIIFRKKYLMLCISRMHGASFTQLSTSHTMDVLFNGLLPELPAILGRFYQDHKCLHK